MPLTSPDNIDYPASTYTSGFVAAMAALATSIQTALTNRARQTFRWANAAARTAQTGMRTDDTGYQIDTAVQYRYNGSAWLSGSTQASTLVIPTSVAGTGVSVGANGAIVAVASPTVSINGCFNSTFENYLIIVKASTIADRLSAKMRLAGVDAASIYSNQTVQGAGGTPTAATNGAAAVGMILSNVAAPIRTKALVTIMAPALAEVTDVLTTAYAVISTTSMGVATLASSVNNTIAYDGITIYPDTGTLSGTIRVYGYNNN